MAGELYPGVLPCLDIILHLAPFRSLQECIIHKDTM